MNKEILLLLTKNGFQRIIIFILIYHCIENILFLIIFAVSVHAIDLRLLQPPSCQRYHHFYHLSLIRYFQTVNQVSISIC